MQQSAVTSIFPYTVHLDACQVSRNLEACQDRKHTKPAGSICMYWLVELEVFEMLLVFWTSVNFFFILSLSMPEKRRSGIQSVKNVKTQTIYYLRSQT